MKTALCSHAPPACTLWGSPFLGHLADAEQRDKESVGRMDSALLSHCAAISLAVMHNKQQTLQ